MEEREIEYQEVFTRSGVPVEGINYKLNAIKEAHPAESGWVMGEPEIIYDSNGKTATINVPLIKYVVERRHIR